MDTLQHRWTACRGILAPLLASLPLLLLSWLAPAHGAIYMPIHCEYLWRHPPTARPPPGLEAEPLLV